MNPTIFTLSALLFLSQPLPADDLPTMVVDSGSKEVDALVARLVSGRPHPFPASGPIPEQFRNEHQSAISGRYITREVAEAIEKLEQLGPGASHYLLSHLDDDRYSYSTTLPSMVGGDFSGWIMVTVGEVARDVITGGFESGWLYKSREGPNDSGFPPPQFSDYLETQGGLVKWVTANSKNSKTEVFGKFIDWCITSERARGFRTKVDEQELVARYEAWKLELEQGRTGQPASRTESEPEGADEPQPEAEDSSR
jgi:hypothetical protein